MRKRPIDIKLQFFKENPHCRYCGVLTELSESGRPSIPSVDNLRMATVDHVYSKFFLKRWVYVRGETRHVLSCRECNTNRQAKEFLTLPPLERLARSFGFNPRLSITYSTIEEAYSEMKKIYVKSGVPWDHLDKQLSS